MEKQVLNEQVYYYIESPDKLHHSDLMDEKCMDSYKSKGKFEVLEPIGEMCGNHEVVAPHEYKIGKIYKRTYQVVMTEEEIL